jgi:hypothetical protein
MKKGPGIGFFLISYPVIALYHLVAFAFILYTGFAFH